MSTPQDNPGGQGWNAPGAADNGQNQQNPYGQAGQGNNGQSGRSTYGSPAGQPSGYAYPAQAGGMGQRAKGPAPKEVERAYHLILAAGIIYLLSSILSSLTTEVPDIAGASFGVGIGILIAAVFAAIYVVLAVFIRKGHNWARITATVLAALNVLSVLSTVLLLPLVTQAAEASGQTIPETPTLTLALSVIVMILGIAGVVMTYLKPARPYFAARQLGY